MNLARILLVAVAVGTVPGCSTTRVPVGPLDDLQTVPDLVYETNRCGSRPRFRVAGPLGMEPPEEIRLITPLGKTVRGKLEKRAKVRLCGFPGTWLGSFLDYKHGILRRDHVDLYWVLMRSGSEWKKARLGCHTCMQSGDMAIVPLVNLGDGDTVTVIVSPMDSTEAVAADASGRSIDGVLFDEHLGRPLAYSGVWISGTKVRTDADINGRFHLAGVPIGEVQLTINPPGVLPKVTVAVPEGHKSMHVDVRFVPVPIAPCNQ